MWVLMHPTREEDRTPLLSETQTARYTAAEAPALGVRCDLCRSCTIHASSYYSRKHTRVITGGGDTAGCVVVALGLLVCSSYSALMRLDLVVQPPLALLPVEVSQLNKG